MTDDLTCQQKFHIEELLFDFEKKINEKFDNEIKEELSILSKYKRELCNSYDEIRGQRNSLIGCMQDIIKFQEELFFMMRDLIKVITDAYPQNIDRIVGVEEENPWK